MKGLLYTVLELEEWNRRATCDFCSGLNKAICEIRTRNRITDKIIASGCACENCKEKLGREELPKCERCGRLQTESRFDFSSGKYICRCIKYGENLEEKELPILPHEKRMDAFYERQISALQEQLNEAEWTIEMEREEVVKFQEKSEEWSKRQKQELLDKIKQLEVEIERLKKLTPQELVNEIESYKEEVARLKTQLDKSNSQQSAQIEVRKWAWLKIRK